ncbi:MAG: NAD(P)H-hydrate dehydratase [Promethearchaeia archaeon]
MKDDEKLSSLDIGKLDKNAEWLGIPPTHLMECAGYSCASEIYDRYQLEKNPKKKVCIFCGTGNNGGDGFVVARHLAALGVSVSLLLIGNPKKIRSDEANLNWNIVSNNLTDSVCSEIAKDSTDVFEFRKEIEDDGNFDIIVDSLLGTGISGTIREPIATAIEVINALKEEEGEDLKVVSVDVPSGLDPDTGHVNDMAIKTDLVITFHRMKQGFDLDNEYIGEIAVKSIGIPPEASRYVGSGDVLPTLNQRAPSNHKGQFGRLLIIGGSKNYSGAPAYSSLTGISYGIDLVITYTPQVVADVLRSYSPNLIVRSSPGDWLTMDSFDEIAELVEWANSIVIGPGLGEEESTEKLLVSLLKKFRNERKSYVLDADGLKLVKNHMDLIKGESAILTPHERELKIMTGVSLPPVDQKKERGIKVFELARELNVTLLVKGPYDYIANPKRMKSNKTGCPEMAIGGTGDVLAGLCASLMATGNDPFEAACSAAFINGKVGEFCKKIFHQRFTAMDMIENLGEVLGDLQ